MTMTAERVQQVRFVEPLPGFADDGTFTFSPIDPDDVLFSLRSVQHPDIRFVLASPGAFFPDYAPDVATLLAGVLGTDDVELLVMLTIGTGLADATANLRAPIVIARSTGRAVQVILEDALLPMRAPLLGL
jgi:flagellar assembly factor FliW